MVVRDNKALKTLNVKMTYVFSLKNVGGSFMLLTSSRVSLKRSGLHASLINI